MTASGHATLDRDRGTELLRRLQDDATTQGWTRTLERRAPGMADWVVTAVFGGTYQRGGLSLRDRQLLNLATLTALGGVDPQLAGHVVTSRRVGMRDDEIVEALVHLVPYVGLPRVLAALRVAADALDGAAAGDPA